MNQEELEQRINESLQKEQTRDSDIWMIFGNIHNQWEPNEMAKINKALRNLDDDASFRLLMDVYDFFKSTPIEEAREVFGEEFLAKPNIKYDAMATLVTSLKDKYTNNRHRSSEFRVWHEFPNYISQEHADSAGSGLILQMIGNPEKVEQFSQKFLEKRNDLTEVELRNGTKLYLRRLDNRPGKYWV